MGNVESALDPPHGGGSGGGRRSGGREGGSFPGSALLDKIPCGSMDDTHQEMGDMGGGGSPSKSRGGTAAASSTLQKLFTQAEYMCIQSPTSVGENNHQTSSNGGGGDGRGGDNRREFFDDEYEDFASGGGGTKNKSKEAMSKKDTTSNNNTASQSPAPPLQAAADGSGKSSALFARALVSEVTDNPKTMRPAAMAERERRLLKAQQRAKNSGNVKDGPKAVGVPGGIGQPSVLGSLAHALTGSTEGLGGVGGRSKNHHHNNNGLSDPLSGKATASILPPNSLSENRAQVGAQTNNNSHHSHNNNMSSDNSIAAEVAPGKYTITIGLSLSRRHSVGHPDTVTRQTAFDFNELQDRQYKYVSSTDSSGWRAGGGERGHAVLPGGGGATATGGGQDTIHHLGADDGSGGMGAMDFDDEFGPCGSPFSGNGGGGAAAGAGATTGGAPPTHPNTITTNNPGTPAGGSQNFKIVAPDTVHIPIIHIDAESPKVVDAIIAALARGEIFIPHMAVLPEALSVNGISPPDLVVRFGTERNDDLPPDDWPNWCLEFMHNQLYEYFQNMGARWMKRPFSITLARKVRWKTVKHMNRYFAHAERVIDAWREKGPQYLDPQLSYIDGGATPEEVARPHGIYLLRNGVPTNYFAPNFDPPYTTKMTRSLLLNVLGKSWNVKRREWTSEPVPRLVTPTMLMATMCGCSDNAAGGFMASEVTLVSHANAGKEHVAALTTIPAPSRTKSHSPDTTTDDVATAAGLPTTTPANRRAKQSPAQQSQQQGPAQQQQQQTPQGSKSRQLPSDDAAADQEDTEKQQLSKETLQQQLQQPLHAKGKVSALTELKITENLLVPTGRNSPRGRAPTPEREVIANYKRQQQYQKEPPNGMTMKSMEPPANNNSATGLYSYKASVAASDVMQASVTGTNSTVMHMNLSTTTDKFMKRDLERRQQQAAQAREEKKEDPVDVSNAVLAEEENQLQRHQQEPLSTGSEPLKSNENWFDPSTTTVSQSVSRTHSIIFMVRHCHSCFSSPRFFFQTIVLCIFFWLVCINTEFADQDWSAGLCGIATTKKQAGEVNPGRRTCPTDCLGGHGSPAQREYTVQRPAH
jgi:hypothetical protein